MAHLIGRYGDEIGVLEQLAAADPSLKEPLGRAPEYLRAEVAFAVRYEGALHVEDVLRHRIRLDYEHRDRGVAAADEVASIMAAVLGWSESEQAQEVEAYRRRVERITAAEKLPDPAQESPGDGETPRILGEPDDEPDDEPGDGCGEGATSGSEGEPGPDGRPALRVVPD